MSEDKNFYSQFYDNVEDNSLKFKIMEILDELDDSEYDFIMNAHDGDLNNSMVTLSSDDTRKYYDLIYEIKNKASDSTKKSDSRFQGKVADSIVQDRISKSPYKRLSLKEESSLIKKAKLAFYDSEDITLEEQEEFLKLYEEVDLNFKEAYSLSEGKKRERILRKAIDKSAESLEWFVANNQRLVFKIANKYKYLADVDELFQEGIMGMLRSIRKFDTSKGLKFATYASGGLDSL